MDFPRQALSLCLRISALIALFILFSLGRVDAQSWTGSDIGSVGVAGTDSYNSTTGVYTIAGSGTDIGGTADACHFVYQSLTADGELEARIASVQNTSSTAKAGVMIRQSTAAGAIESMIALEPANSVLFLNRTSSGGSTTSSSVGTSSPPYWVHIIKDGTLITIYQSPDGVNWTYAGLTRLTALTNPVDIGFAVTSDNNSQLCTATFDHITLSSQASYAPTSPWHDQDIGTTGQAGQIHLEYGDWSLYGAGSGLAGTADSFHYGYQALKGNGVVLARIDGLNTSTTSSGVVMRQDLTAGAAEAAVLLNFTNGITFATRASSGGTLANVAGAHVSTPYWVKLVRAGNVFYGYEAPDGFTWTLVGSQTISMTGTIYVGVGTTSGSTSTLALGLLDRVAVVPTGNYLANGDISSGAAHNLYLTTGGLVWAWGLNSNGQLGDGTTTQRNSPVPLAAPSGVEAISAGELHSLALQNNGTVWAWGCNSNGQLGDGSTTQEAAPEQLSSLSGMMAVSAGAYHSIGLKNDGTVWVWGDNDNGQLGDGTTIQEASPEQLTTLSGIIAVSAGANHSLALRSDGTVWAWGLNSSGQVGDGTTIQRKSPVQLTGLSNIVSISAGTNHSLAVDVDGNVWAWGDNSSGEIGNGGTTQANTPVQITTLSGMTGVKASNLFSLALSSTGAVYGWGNNTYGQLGDNNAIQQNSPVPTSVLTNAVAISAGYWHSSALASSAIWTWGNNSYGQLGNGTTTSSLIPISINPGVPVITSSTSAGGTTGSVFTYAITATNLPTNFAATGLPSGLSINTQTGVISGTPASTGSYTIPISATNITGTGTGTLSLTVSLGSPPVINSSATASGNTGAAFSYTITATNTPTSFTATGLPAGLSLNVSTGAITGTPTAVGTSSVALGATNAGGTGTLTLTITIKPPAPVITSATSATGTTGTAFSYQVTANNSPVSYSASGLPAGLSINTSTGAISGTPTAAGTSSVSLGATNTGGTGTATLSLTINLPTPAITSGTTATGTLGTAFSGYTIAGSNTPTSFSATGLPPGLSVSSSTGAITGTPTEAGTFSVKIGATNATGTGTATLTFTVNNPKPIITSPTSAIGVTSSAFSYSITANNSPTSYNATGLPAGLSVSTSTGAITGTPTTVGTSSVSLSAINASGTGTATLSITINAPKPVISSATTATGTTGAAFSYTIAASNTPTSFGATGLPAGLSVNTASGAITGTPTTAGSYPVTIGATNATGTGIATLTITVNSPTPVINSLTSALGNTGAAFAYNITATNSPTSYSATGLPAGLSVSTSTGKISGTPTATGTSSVTIGAINATGTGTATLSITINSPTPVISSATTGSGTIGTAFGGYTITATNTPTSYSASGLPSGLTLAASTGVISGTPTSAGTFTVKLGATNANGTGTLTLTLTIKPLAPVISSPLTATGTIGVAFSSYSVAASNNPTSYSASGLPAGLSINTTTGAVTGTPTTAGTSTVTLGATNSGGTGNATLSFTINQAKPVIYSPASAAGTVGTAFSSYTILASNSPTSYGATSLPAGLSVNTTTGAITGTPTTAGTSSVTLSATNGSGTGNLTLSFKIASSAVPVISSATTDTGTTGTAITTYTIAASNTPTSYSATGLPAGLSVSTSTGAITGTPTTAGISYVTLGATNANGTGTALLTFTVNSPKPVINSPTTATAVQGTAFSGYAVTATNNPTSLGATGLPAGLSVNTTTGIISGTPTAAGSSSVSLSATNANGTGTATLTFTVTAPLPVITSGATATGTTGTAFTYTTTASNSPTSFTATGLPAGLSINSTSGAITGTPTIAGSYSVTLGATNVTGTGTATLALTINPTTPVITSPATATGVTGTAFSSYTITANNSPVSYNATGLPAGLSINTSTGAITGTPTTAGTSTVALSATNSGGTGTQNLTFTVNNPKPVITSATTASATQGAAFSGYTITASNTPVSFSATGLPAGLSVNTTSGAISGTPTSVGTYAVTIGAINPTGTGTATLTLTVSPATPVVNSLLTAVGVTGSSFSYTITASNTPTSYSASGLPAGLSVSTTTGKITGTPTTTGTSSVTLGATNGSGTGSATLALTINSPTPVISSANTATGTTGSAFSYTIAASNSPTSFSATSLPAGLSLNTTSGAITGSPTTAGTSTVTLGASNSTGTGTLSLTLTVIPPQPVITSLTAATGTTGSSFTYTITASNSPTSYSATGLPAGLSVSTSTGKITGTPTAVGTSSVTLGATNANGTGSATLTLIVNPPLPVVSSSATATGNTGSAFSYTITGSNSPTSFSATNLPPGLSVNSSTGAITGTPTATGTFTVTVGASNGSGSGIKTVAMTISLAAPVISSPTTASGATGIAFTYGISASNGPTSFNATGLPGGLSVSTTTGAITGTPTTAGTFPITLSATNAGGTATATLTLSVSLTAPVITSSGSATGVAGTNVNYTITATSTPTSFGANGLPPGLTLNTTTGSIQGSATISGTFTVQLTASNSVGTGSETLTLTINAAPSVLPVTSGLSAWFEANAGVTNQAGSVTQWNDQTANQYNVTQTAGNGNPGISQDSQSGLPVLTFNGNQYLTSNSQLSGANDVTIITVASAVSPSNNGIQVVVGNAYASTAARAFGYDSNELTFSNGEDFSDEGSPPANSGLNVESMTYSQSSGMASFFIQGVADGTTSLSAATLNAGLTIGSILNYTAYDSWNGNIAEVIVYNRVLTTTERQSIEIYLANKYDIYAPGASWIGNYSSTVQTLINQNQWSQAQTVQYLQTTYPVPVITSATTATGFVGGVFSYNITGSNSPTYFSASGLPSGLTLSSNTGVISGTPTVAGTYSVTLTAVNANGPGQAVLSLTVQPAIPVISSSLVGGGTQNLPFNYTITAGSGATSFGATGLPTGLSVNTTTGVISGTPTATGTSTVTLTATNINGTGQANMALTIYAPLPVTSGLSAWYSAQAGVSTTSGGVTQWNDQTGQYNLTQSAGASAPSFGADPITGKPVVQFNGSQFLSNSSQVTGVNDVTIITVGSVPTTGESGVQVQVGAGYGSACSRGLAYVGGDVAFTNGINSGGYFTSVSGGPAVQNSSLALNTLTYSSVSSLASFFTDGSANGTATLSTVATASGMIVGDAITYGNYYNWNGNIAEIIVYNRVLSTVERQQVENYLASKYNLPPVINSPTTATAVTGTAFNYTVTATDVPTTYGATGLPAGLSINTSTGAISGTPTATGVSYVTIAATNAGGTSSETLTLTTYAPVAPVITSPTTTAAVIGQAFNYAIVGNNNTTSYNATGLPGGLSVNTTTGAITGTPTATGTSTVALSATNAYGTGTANLMLTIYPTLPVTSGLAAWFNSDVGVTTSSGNVTQWNDQSGNGYNVTQSVGPTAPTVGTDTASGNPVVSFNGNQYLNSNSTTSVTSDVTIVTVSSMANSSNSGTSVVVGNAYSSSSARTAYDDSGNQSYNDGTNVGDGGSLSSNGLLNVSTVTYSQSSSLASFYSEGSANGTYSVTSSSVNAGLTIGSLLNYTPYIAWNGNIAEVIVYNRVLTTTERQQVESYLASKYGSYVPGAAWINSYTTAVQAEINRNQWNKVQADAYVSFQNANSGMLTNGLRMWLKADAGAITNGGKITSWLDQTGNYTLTQSNTVNQPTYVASESTGVPGLHFSGSQWLFNPVGMGVGMNQDSTIITIASTSQPLNTQEYSVCLGNGNGDTARSIGYGSSNQIYDFFGNEVQGIPAPSANTFNVEMATVNSTSTSVAFYRNGVSTGTSTVSGVQNLTNGITVGALVGGGDGWQGDISEVLVYDHQLSTAEMQQVNLYLASRYGLYYPGASWISSFTTTVQAEINRNQWNKTQANNYVAMQTANPSMLTNGLKLWLKADSGVTTGVGSYVNGWADQTGNYPVTQNQFYGQPLLVTNDSNGEPALRFTGSQSLTNPSSLGAGAGADMTVITVGMTTSPSSPEYSLYLGNATTGESRAIGYNNQNQYFDTTGSTASGIAAPANNLFAVESASINSTLTSVNLYRNGVQTGTGTLSGLLSPNAGITVGGAGNNGSFWQGDISEVLVYDHQLSSTELQQVSLYLANKYGLYYSGASWISSYTTAVQTLINANQWNKVVADAYVQVSATLPVATGLAAWFKADSGVVTNGNGQVIGWEDSSWNHNDVVAPQATSAPTTGTDPGTGTPTVQFNGSQYLDNFNSVSSINDVTIITVASTPTPQASAISTLVTIGDDTSGNAGADRALVYNHGYQGFTNGTITYGLNVENGGTVGTATTLNNSAVTYSASSKVATFYLNGVANGSASGITTSVPANGIALGLLTYSVPTNSWTGNISEVLIYNRVLSSTEISQVQTYLATKYAPYSVAAPTFSPVSGSNITTSTAISLSGAISPAVIRYTLNGTAPTSSSTQYTGTFNLTQDAEIVECAVFSGSQQISPVATGQFWIGDTYHIGIPDAWQTQYLGSVTNLNPNALTPGGSGLTYLQAYQWGYNPTLYSTNGDGLSDLVNYQLGYAGSNTDINGYLTGTGAPMTNAQQLALGLDPFDIGVNPPQPTPPATNPNDHTPPPITLNQPANAVLLP